MFQMESRQMAYSKDPEHVPSFVSEVDAPNVSLVTTTDLIDGQARDNGFTTPGWNLQRTVEKTNGSTKKTTETLIAFSGAGTRPPVTPDP